MYECQCRHAKPRATLVKSQCSPILTVLLFQNWWSIQWLNNVTIQWFSCQWESKQVHKMLNQLSTSTSTSPEPELGLLWLKRFIRDPCPMCFQYKWGGDKIHSDQTNQSEIFSILFCVCPLSWAVEGFYKIVLLSGSFNLSTCNCLIFLTWTAKAQYGLKINLLNRVVKNSDWNLSPSTYNGSMLQ